MASKDATDELHAKRMTAGGGRKLLVVDTDPGLDDAQAILMLLADPAIEIIAFTTVRGITDVEQLSSNLLRLLKMAGRLDVSYACKWRMCGCASKLSFL